MSILVEEATLKDILREVIREEFINLSVNLIPHVTQEEMEEINQTYGEEDFSDTANDFIDMTEWLNEKCLESRKLNQRRQSYAGNF